eukprot:7123000-Prorocentrum_lima.AAC.1
MSNDAIKFSRGSRTSTAIVQNGRGLNPSAASPGFKHLQVPNITVSGSVLLMEGARLSLVGLLQLFKPK